MNNTYKQLNIQGAHSVFYGISKIAKFRRDREILWNAKNMNINFACLEYILVVGVEFWSTATFESKFNVLPNKESFQYNLRPLKSA
jgi:hypothetical protein